jgi:hypothetical protein
MLLIAVGMVSRLFRRGGGAPSGKEPLPGSATIPHTLFQTDRPKR